MRPSKTLCLVSLIKRSLAAFTMSRKLRCGSPYCIFVSSVCCIRPRYHWLCENGDDRLIYEYVANGKIS
jgi:hypothetical protein